MSQIDPYHIVVLVRDGSGDIVRIGVSSWQQLREVVQTDGADDVRRFKDVEAQVTKARQTGVVSS